VVIAAWARIMRDVPGSRLVLNCRPFREAAFRALFAALRNTRHRAGSAQIETVELPRLNAPLSEAAVYGEIGFAPCCPRPAWRLRKTPHCLRTARP
jgi:hypothetical protein